MIATQNAPSLQDHVKTEETNRVRIGRSYGSFYQRLPVPNGVSEDNITAAQADGVLEIRINQPSLPGGAPSWCPAFHVAGMQRQMPVCNSFRLTNCLPCK